MARQNCPGCNNRLPYAARRCVHCGWTVGQSVDPDARPYRRAISVLLVLIAILAGGVAYVNAAVIADWYAAFAATHLPEGASSIGPANTEAGAFYYCARQVSRRITGDLAVETFPSEEHRHMEPLGDGRYRVESFVDETLQDGRNVRVDFTCVTSYGRGRWVLEELEMNSGLAERGEGGGMRDER